MNTMQTVMEDIQKTWGDQVEVLEDKYFDMIKVPAPILPELFQKLNREHGFNYLANLTAVDYKDRFEFCLLYTSQADSYGYIDKRPDGFAKRSHLGRGYRFPPTWLKKSAHYGHSCLSDGRDGNRSPGSPLHQIAARNSAGTV